MTFESITAEWALLVAIATAAFTLGALVWEVVRYWLVGARLIVRLVPGVVSEVGHIFRSESGWSSSTPETMIRTVGHRPWIDVAIISVTNYGRTPISVSEVALDFGPSPRWKPWSRHTIVGHPVERYGGAGAAPDYRLKPAQSLTVIYEAWSLIEAARDDDREATLKVRASVLPARRWIRRKRSPRRRRWRITPRQTSIWAQGPDHEHLELFRAVWREVAPKYADQTYNAWIAISSLFTDFEHGEPPDYISPSANPSIAELADALQPPFDEKGASAAAMNIWVDWMRNTGAES